MKIMENLVFQNSEISKVLQYLAPWIEKTDGEESIGSWETTMATKMMVKRLTVCLRSSQLRTSCAASDWKVNRRHVAVPARCWQTIWP